MVVLLPELLPPGELSVGGDELASVPPLAVPLLSLLVSPTPDSVQLSAMTLAKLGCSDVDAATVITLDIPLLSPLLIPAPGHSLPIPFAEDVSDFHNSCTVSALTPSARASCSAWSVDCSAFCSSAWLQHCSARQLSWPAQRCPAWSASFPRLSCCSAWPLSSGWPGWCSARSVSPLLSTSSCSSHNYLLTEHYRT